MVNIRSLLFVSLIGLGLNAYGGFFENLRENAEDFASQFMSNETREKLGDRAANALGNLAEAKLKKQQWNESDRDRIKEEKKIESDLKIERTKAKIESVGRLLKDKRFLTGGGVTVVSVAGGIFAFKYGLPIVTRILEERLFTPALIDETSFVLKLPWKKKVTAEHRLSDLHFDADLNARVNRILKMLWQTNQNGDYYLNYLFYGEPGTGKTAAARAIALESGMHYAIMSGGNVQKLLKSGKAEQRLKEVFGWAKKSKKGLLLFIDEADAFLKDPNSSEMTEELYSVLNSFLNLTGTESKNISIVLSTNHPQKLAKAVVDRVGPGQLVYFGLPKYEQRKNIISHLVPKYFVNHQSNLIGKDMISYIAKKTEGFSGRNLSYLMLSIHKELLVADKAKLNQKFLDEIIEQAVQQRTASLQFKSYA